MSWSLTFAGVAGLVPNYGGIGVTGDGPGLLRLVVLATLGGVVAAATVGTVGSGIVPFVESPDRLPVSRTSLLSVLTASGGAAISLSWTGHRRHGEHAEPSPYTRVTHAR